MIRTFFQSRTRLDAFLALVCVLVAIAQGAIAERMGLLGWIFLLIGPLALLLRSRSPRAVLLVTFGASVAVILTSDIGYLPVVAVLVSIVTVAGAGHYWLSSAVVGGVLASVVAMRLPDGGGSVTETQLLEFMVFAGWFLVALKVGVALRFYRLAMTESQEKVAQMERSREETALRKASEERLRIARELHDSLVHTISVIRVHSSVAVHLARKKGEVVPDSTLAIYEAAQEANRELRQTLGMLRDEEIQNGISRLEDLVNRSQSTELAVDLRVDPQLESESEKVHIPSTVDHTVYRIVQESLTNVARHSTGNKAEISIAYADRGIDVLVADNGHISPSVATAPGNGLTGMSERVSALGGELTAGPSESGGFRVHARLPVAASR
ncbi:sensor histidine kinase [Natronoglycomyces albus]|uniref:histidine kinase n=1 Tax=Natronoglycomyces albus TaxID=2811108 RepID=A0A895XL08_9ACTN|nr:histidine kinase [Natronoglycomyces albus]QSB04109.1 sensor histidine kinase [Natronoglycomyces albus]